MRIPLPRSTKNRRRLFATLVVVAACVALFLPTVRTGSISGLTKADDAKSLKSLAPGSMSQDPPADSANAPQEGESGIASAPALPDSDKFKLIDTQDFNGHAVDTSRWGLYKGPGTNNVGTRSPSAITVSDGQVHITGTGKTIGGMSQNRIGNLKAGQTYGRWVIRAKQDVGQGYGPAILLWPDSEKWPKDGELDIVEMTRADRSAIITTVHHGPDSDHDYQEDKKVEGDFTGWHTYAVDWLPDHITFYVDGNPYYTVTDKAAIPHNPMHLALQLELGSCGSDWMGCPDATTPPSVALHVDYVQVFSRVP